jgi:hypothetical protein
LISLWLFGTLSVVVDFMASLGLDVKMKCLLPGLAIRGADFSSNNILRDAC